MVRTQIQLTEEQVSRLKKLAGEKRMSVAQLIRQAIDATLKRSAVMGESEKKLKALSVTGRFKSGLKDISSEHDKHLSDIYSQ